jgi:iron complex outermembrane receptor protein
MNTYLQKSFPVLTPLLLSLPFSINANDIDAFGDLDFSLPIVTSASRLSESVLSSPSAVTVLDQALIEASGFTEIADLMRLVPGFIVSHAWGGNLAVINHGEGSELPNRMQILIDGRSTYTNALSAIEWNALGVHIEDIERIEVVRGPAASAYGSNSYSGAINIVTKTPELDDKYHVRYRYGNVGERELLLRHSGKLDKVAYRVTAASRNSNGYERVLETRTDPSTYIDDYRDNKDLSEFSLTTNVQLSPTSTLWGNFSYTDSTVQAPNLFPEDTSIFSDPDIEIDGWSANLKWTKQLSENDEFSINFFHNYLDEHDLGAALLSDVVSPGAFAFIGEDDQYIEAGLRTFRSTRSDIELQYTKLFENGSQYVVGYGARYDTAESEFFFPSKGDVSNTSHRFFANGQHPVSSYLTVNVGGLYEMSQIDEDHFSPRASLNFHLNEKQTIRTGYSRAYRIPSITEQSFDAKIITQGGFLLDNSYVTNSDLSAERVTSFDISYLGQLRSQPVSWEFRAYREEYQNTVGFVVNQTITDPFDQRVNTVENAGDSKMYGFEGEVTFRPEKFSFVRLNFNLGRMSGTRLHRILPTGEKVYRDLENRAPQKTYALLAGKQVNSWKFNMGVYHVSKMEWDGYGDEVDSYTRIDASIAKDIKISKDQIIQLKLAGQNLNNKEYNEFMTDTDLIFKPRYYASISLIHK